MPAIFRGLYDRVLELSRHRHAERYLVGLTVAEATVFPVPPDVMLAPMVLADRPRAWRLALMTTIASVLGGLIGYLIGAGFTPIPFKIITVAGGALAMALPGFILGSIIGRGARFFLVAGIIYAGGEKAAEHLREWVDAIGWAMVALILIAGLAWWWFT
jgi:membrane protein YqaA with SNARE-associated domain